MDLPLIDSAKYPARRTLCISKEMESKFLDMKTSNVDVATWIRKVIAQELDKLGDIDKLKLPK